jgi:hypothetical protein
MEVSSSTHIMTSVEERIACLTELMSLLRLTFIRGDNYILSLVRVLRSLHAGLWLKQGTVFCETIVAS